MPESRSKKNILLSVFLSCVPDLIFITGGILIVFGIYLLHFPSAVIAAGIILTLISNPIFKKRVK